MVIKNVPCFTVICDGCGTDAADSSEYSGFGPTGSDAEDAFCDDWHTNNGKHFCPDCKPSWCMECEQDITEANPRCANDAWSCASCHTDCLEESQCR